MVHVYWALLGFETFQHSNHHKPDKRLAKRAAPTPQHPQRSRSAPTARPAGSPLLHVKHSLRHAGGRAQPLLHRETPVGRLELVHHQGLQEVGRGVGVVCKRREVRSSTRSKVRRGGSGKEARPASTAACQGCARSGPLVWSQCVPKPAERGFPLPPLLTASQPAALQAAGADDEAAGHRENQVHNVLQMKHRAREWMERWAQCGAQCAASAMAGRRQRDGGATGTGATRTGSH